MSLYREDTSSYWWCRFQVNGKSHRVSTGKTNKTEARYEEERLRAEARAKAASEPRSRIAPGTLLDLSGLDVDRAINEGADKDIVTATLTAIWSPITQHFGVDFDIANLTPVSMEEYVSARRNWPKLHPKTGETMGYRRIAGQTIRREIAALKRACIIAKKRGWIAHIPDEFPKLRKDPKNVAMKGKLRSPELLRKLLNEANDRRRKNSSDDTVRDHLLFCVLTGLRAEELHKVRETWVEPLPPGLKVEDVVAILRPPEAGTKTGEERYIGLVQEALDVIERRKAVAKDGVLFPHKSVGQWLRRYCKKEGIGPAVSLRDLRHSFSTYGLHGTSDAVSVQEAMGHADLRTTQTYQSSTIARVAAVSVAVARTVLGTGQAVVRPESSDAKKEVAKSPVFKHARLAQLDRALVSEAERFVSLLSFSSAEDTKKTLENIRQLSDDLSDAVVRPAVEYARVNVMCEKCGRTSELEESPTYECVFCGAQAFPLAEVVQDATLPEEVPHEDTCDLTVSAVDRVRGHHDAGGSRRVGKSTERR